MGLVRFAPWDDAPQFKAWRTGAQVAVEADDFTKNVLWTQWSNEGAQFWTRGPAIRGEEGVKRLAWEPCGVGRCAQVGEPLFSKRCPDGVLTCVNIAVDLLDGVPVLFYWAGSVLVDHDAVDTWLHATFINARGRHHDATNFGNAVHDIREIAASAKPSKKRTG